VVEGASPPLPVARLFLQPDGPGLAVSAGLEPAKSGADGAFRINDVAAGSYHIRATFGTNATPEWVAESVAVSVEKAQTTRGVQVVAARGALLEVLVIGKNDRKPLPEANVSAYKEDFQSAATLGSNGLAVLRLLPGDYQVSAYKEGWRSETTTASVEAGKTNRIEIETAPPPRITGVVRRPDGQPAAKLPVRIIGGYSSPDAQAETDAQGRFDVEWNSRRVGPDNTSCCLFIRDAERNLAVAQDIDEETGPLDLRLAPGLTLAGRTECDGKPIAKASAVLVFWTSNSGMHVNGLSTGTNTPGHFEITALPPGRRYSLYVSAPGYGQRYVNQVDASEARRIELDPVELRPANLKLAGKVVDADDKPVAGANVNLYGDGQPNGNVGTDHDGRFAFDKVCEGMVRLSANARSASGSISAEGGDTNVVLRLVGSYSTSPSAKLRKLKGLVTDPAGQPVAGAQAAVFPSLGSSRWIKTTTNGSYSLSWQMRSGNPSLVVRELARNLAAAEEIAEEATNLDVRLKPALTVTGRVEDSAGAPLTNAEVGVSLKTGNSYYQLNEQFTAPDTQGRFEIKSLPVDGHYRVFAKAKGHGRSQQDVALDAETNRVELPALVLPLADRALAGLVLGMNDKPSPGVQVSLSGENQPDGYLTTDSKGRFSFKVCEGQVRLRASGPDSYANLTAEAGDTNVILQLRGYSSSSRPAAKRALLKGKPLPDLAAIGLAPEAIPAGRPLLLCLFDCEQRSSRRCLRLLAEQYEAMGKKGLVVVAVQAAATTAESFKTWQQASPMPFPLGRIAEKTTTTKWASEMEAMPCLILTDKERKVVAEGFALDELDEKVKALNK
ncbi:MAG: carboxypeptidase-like regulatory domain-containing protein, partial [Verrucomicrobia bacterium]|nr:carboxypeptidase-like regulatory domain-containing protein [Verrucomicrobiota bacterium]